MFPLAQKSIKTQALIRKIDPELKKIKNKFKDNKEEQAKKTMALYKEHHINPFSGFLLTSLTLSVYEGSIFASSTPIEPPEPNIVCIFIFLVMATTC